LNIIIAVNHPAKITPHPEVGGEEGEGGGRGEGDVEIK